MLRDLTDLQKETHVETCVALLNWYRNEGILDRIVACDKKWIVSDNHMRQMQAGPRYQVWTVPATPDDSKTSNETAPTNESIFKIMLHVDARPHTAWETVLTLQELQLETIRHPP